MELILCNGGPASGEWRERPPSRILVKVPSLEEGRSWFRSRVRTVSEDFLGWISG